MPGAPDIDLSFFNREYFGETVSDYLWFAGIIIGTLLLKKPLVTLLARISSRMAARFNYLQYKSIIRDMLFKPLERLLITVLFYVAINKISDLLDKFVIHQSLSRKYPIQVSLGDIIDNVFRFLFFIFLAQFVNQLLEFTYLLQVNKAGEEKNTARKQLLPLINEVSRLLVWILCVFCVLGLVFHVNVPALITGLGIGGVAIALAGKETVENFLAAFIILSDKPFQVGDVIRLGDLDAIGVIEAAVERIGFRSTRLRHTDGSQYIIPNQKLVSKNIINLSTRETRGVKLTVNMAYGIPSDALQRIIAGTKDFITRYPHITGAADVAIETFDKDAFQLTVSYFLPHPLPEGASLAATKRDINLKIYELLASETATPPGAAQMASAGQTGSDT